MPNFCRIQANHAGPGGVWRLWHDAQSENVLLAKKRVARIVLLHPWAHWRLSGGIGLRHISQSG